METNKASQTAEIMARHRAAELQFPEDQRVCNDPYAFYFVSEEAKKSFNKPLRSLLTRLWVNWMFPGVHNGVISRVRYMDDCVMECLKNGMEQMVIIAAGYDTRAYRFNGLSESVNVFELDHPATQKRKMKSLLKSFVLCLGMSPIFRFIWTKIISLKNCLKADMTNQKGLFLSWKGY